MRVSTCCCGCSLETGCKIIAILGLIFGGLELIAGIVAMVRLTNSFLVIVIHGVLYIIAAGLLLLGTL